MNLFKKIKDSLFSEQTIGFLISFAILSLLTIIVFRNFIFSDEWPAGGDVLGWISRAYLYGKDGRWLYMWRPFSFGFVEIINLLDSFLFLFHLAFLNPQTTVKAFMFFSFLLACISSYLFAYKYSKNHIAALAGSFTYSMNHWVISQLFEAHLGILFNYALAPLLFVTLDNALRRTKLKDILILGILSSVVLASFHAEFIVIYGFFFGSYLIFFILFPGKSNSFKTRAKKLAKLLFLTVPAGFLLLSFLLIPFLMNVRPYYFSPNYRYLIEDVVFFSYKNFFDALTLRATEAWGYIKYVDYSSGLSFPGFPVTLMTIIFLLPYSILLFRRDRYTVFFAFSTVASSIIAMGPNSSFGELFIWAWHNIPHFSVFRAISRWIVLAALSHVFFISLFAATLIDGLKKYVQKPTTKTFFKVKTKRGLFAEPRIYYVSVDIFNKIHNRLRKLTYYLSIFMLALILMSPLLYSYFLISQGLQVYTPSKNYLRPYFWIAQQTGDYRIVTVGQHPTDFADGAMYTDLGWTHEIGYESVFIHDKPVLQNGGWEYLPHSFVDFLRFHVVPQKMTSSLMKILGTFNCRYVVIPVYASDENRYFFMEQDNVKIVYNNSGSIILENEDYNQRIFGVTQFAVVIGDLEVLPALYKIDSFNLNQTALLFAHLMSSPFYKDPMFNKSQYLIFYNVEMADIVMLTFKDEPFMVKLAQYGIDSSNPSHSWIRSPVWRHQGKYVFGSDVLQTSGKNSVKIFFDVNEPDLYSLWIRVGIASSRGTLTVMLDEVNLTSFQPETAYGPKLSWIFLGNLSLDEGRHSLTLINDGNGLNEVDAFAFIKPKTYKMRENEIIEAIRRFKGRIIYLLEAEEFLKPEEETGACSYKHVPYEGFSLHLNGQGKNIAFTANVSASSVFGNDSMRFGSDFAIDNSPLTRWASEPSEGMPQWLELTWPSKQKITGLQIFFENAKAQNYTVQSWNGTNWINQTIVTGNNQTIVYHSFSSPFETEKLRLYFTSAPEFGMVSIWELQVYSGKNAVSSEFFVPRSGYYSLAFRLAFHADYRPFDIILGNASLQIFPSNKTDKFEWYETEQVSLLYGKYHLEIRTDNEIDLDQLILCSTDLNESFSVTKIFSDYSSQPTISYKRINPCEYEVYINSNSSFFLIFSDSYHPLWRLYIGNEEISPISINYCVNGFFVDRTGEFKAVLYFVGQRYTDLGYRISLGTAIILLIILVFHGKIEKLIKNLKRRNRSEVKL